jgi:cytochrome c
MFKYYHRKIISSALVASVVLLGTACNASVESDKKAEETKTEAVKTVETKVVETTKVEAKVTTANPAVGSVVAQVSDSVKRTYDFNSKKVIDGGVTYPILNGKTGAYSANENAHKATISYGKTATANEQKAWDIDVMPGGTGLPDGSGSAEDGDEIYEEQCVSCHGDFGAGAGAYPKLTAGNAYEMQKTMTNQRVDGNEEGPQRTFGSYWPDASTAWWYIKTGMPHTAPMSLSNDEVYALVAYMLSINEIKIDGELVDEEYVLDKEKFLKIKMPNADGFEPNIDGPTGPDDVRAYYDDVSNYGNGTRCMKDCFEGEPVVQAAANPLTEFNPPLSREKFIPEAPANAKPDHAGKAGYDKSCAICHATDSMGAPDVGNEKAWSKVMKEGINTVYSNAINGKNGMPPKGGAMALSDDEIKVIVDYMVEESK